MDYNKINIITEDEFADLTREEAKQYVVKWFMNESKNSYISEQDRYLAYKMAHLILKDVDEISPYSADSIIYGWWTTMYYPNKNTKEFDKEFMINQYYKYNLI